MVQIWGFMEKEISGKLGCFHAVADGVILVPNLKDDITHVWSEH